jgi:hypothetical protein
MGCKFIPGFAVVFLFLFVAYEDWHSYTSQFGPPKLLPPFRTTTRGLQSDPQGGATVGFVLGFLGEGSGPNSSSP